MTSARTTLTWEDMTVGMTSSTSRRTITETDLVSFVTSTGLFEVLFMDVPNLESTPFEGRLVPAALTYSFAEGLSVQGGGWHDSGLAFLGMELKVIKPVYVGDTIQVRSEIIEARPASKGGRGVVTARNTVVNQHGEPVLEYTPVRLVKGKADVAAEAEAK